MEIAYTATLNTYINSCLTYLFARESTYYGGTEDVEELQRNQHPMIPENTHLAVHFASFSFYLFIFNKPVSRNFSPIRQMAA